MNGIIIVNQTIGHNQYKIERFKEEFAKKGVSLEVFINDGTLAEIKNNNIVINLPKNDFVLYLDKDIYLARLLEKSGYRLFNRADFIKMCDDKMLTFIRCADECIKMPNTIIFWKINNNVIIFDFRKSSIVNENFKRNTFLGEFFFEAFNFILVVTNGLINNDNSVHTVIIL